MKYTTKSVIHSILLLALIHGLACSKKKQDSGPNPQTDILNSISKVWVPLTVSENGLNVFNINSSSNIKNYYSLFKMDISKPPIIYITEIDGMTFTGTFKLVDDRKIEILFENPAPFGTNGQVTYFIEQYNENELIIKRSEGNPKTGTTATVYTLKSK